MCSRLLTGSMCLVLIAAAASAKNNKVLGNDLIVKARKISDIRAEGAPAFRLEGTFRSIPKEAGGREIKGSYTEVWVSATKWRREVRTSSSTLVEIGIGTQIWHANTGSDRLWAVLSPPVTRSHEQMIAGDTAEIDKISDRQVDSLKMTCVESKSNWSKGIDCLDPGTGALLIHEISGGTKWSPFHYSCIYRNYEQFGEELFPRSVRCRNRPGDTIELTIFKLSNETTPDEALFAKPPGAVETRHCQAGVNAPSPIYTPDAILPGQHGQKITVVLWTAVDENGNVRDSKIARTGGDYFDHLALNTLRQWKFKPAMCGNVPIAVAMEIEMNF